MPYSAEISRGKPSCFLFLIDQSGSMQDTIHGKTKAQGVADAINRLLQNLVIKCAKSEGVRDYYEVGVVGYGANVGPAFTGELQGLNLVPISAIGNAPARIEQRTKKIDDGAGGLLDQTVKFPIWFDPTANGGTPMCKAISHVYGVLKTWVALHSDNFPPVVIHITDGESTDGNPMEAMNKLKSLATNDGNLLLFNLHLSDNPEAKTILFADSPVGLPDEYARILWDGASPLTPFMRSVAQQEHSLALTDGARGFVLNGDLISIIQALDIGTRPSNLR